MHTPAMPAVSALFSGPVSVGLLAGVVSGLFYLVVAGFRWAGRLRAARECERQRRLWRQRLLDADSPEDGVHAGGDGGEGEEPVREVKQQSGEWLYRQVQRRLHPARAVASLRDPDDGADMEPETVRVREFIERLVESLVSGELDNVCVKRLHSHPEYDRMFACHHAPLCEALARLSFALQMAIANKHMTDHNSPSAAHAALKKLVHQIIKEAMTLPKFKGVKPSDDDVKQLEDIDSKTYEDILATAILNKVIERYQQSDRSSGTELDGNSNLLTSELMSLVALHQTKYLGNTESGVSPHRSSDEGRFFSNDGDTLSELSNTDPLSVTIEECIEEVTTFSNAEEEEDGVDGESYLPGLDVFKNRRAPFPEYGRDIIDGPPLDVSDDGEDEGTSEDEASMHPTDIINPVDSWEENWLFQKRRLKVGGVAQPMPVPMLVPNPSEDYRALIGDRDAEDVSDLSDCSDGALEDVVLAEDENTEELTEIEGISATSAVNKHEESIENGTVNNSHIPLLQKDAKEARENKVCIVLNDLDKTKSMLHEDDDKELLHEIEELTEAKNMEYLKSTSEDCLSEFGQQEGEYTEDYAAVAQRQMDSLTAMSDPDATDVPELPTTPIPCFSPEASTIDEAVVAILEDLVPGESDTDQVSPSPLVNAELAKPPRPGTIAEREHKKWETAPPLPNNPYSPENIIKRLNKKHFYNQSNSNNDPSINFPELKEEPIIEKVIEQPLQVLCSPSDIDYKRYGRDYYINAHPESNGKVKQMASSSQQQEWLQENEHISTEFATDEIANNNVDDAEIQDSNNIETKVALWQKEINEADQYYKNILNKKQEQVPDSSSNEYNYQTDSSSFYKSMLNNGNDENHENNEIKYVKPKNKNKLRDTLKEIEKTEGNGTDANENKVVPLTQSNSDHKTNKTDNNLEAYGILRRSSNMGSSLSINENGNDGYTNGYSRSDSPSGSSVLTSDSDFGMPSVRELTKRFSVRVDSDSSASTPKSISPSPQWRKKDQHLQQREKDEIKGEPQFISSATSVPRPVREIHSLTARSISKEFREELRHNQPIPLNKNVYKQMNPKHINGMNSRITEENSLSGNTSLSPQPKSPVPCRSMQSSIAFWEQMQKKKS